jgi:pterin-4a-carbinolamine dehydratase
MSTTQVINTLTVEIPGLRRPPRPPEMIPDPLLKPERVQETLAAAPAWQLLGEAKSLRREKTFPDAMAALLYSSFVSSLASRFNVRASVRVQDLRVIVTLGSARKGRTPLSEAQLAFALMIS